MGWPDGCEAERELEEALARGAAGSTHEHVEVPTLQPQMTATSAPDIGRRKSPRGGGGSPLARRGAGSLQMPPPGTDAFAQDSASSVSAADSVAPAPRVPKAVVAAPSAVVVAASQ